MGFIADAIEDIGDFIGDTVEAIVDNPIGALVSVGGMALGIPPVYAGALGGAANAAAHDGNILEGALLGGAMGYAGGAAGSAAAEAGASSALAGAAGGAAAGALGSAATGGDIIKGALTGGFMGGATGFVAGQVNNQDGTFTRTNDDGSVVRFNSKGDILQVSPATDGTPAPVYEWNPNTQQMQLVSGNGTAALNILDAQQTADLMKNIDPRMVNSLADDGVFRVEVGGLPGTAENPGYANIEARTPGTNLATFDQIDAGQARWNPAANAWEVGDFSLFEPTDSNYGAFGEPPTSGPVLPGEVVTQPYQGNDTYSFDNGTNITIDRNGQATSTDAAGTVHNLGGGTAYASGNGATTYRFDDGSWMTINPDGSSIVADSNGTVTTHAGGTYTGGSTGGQPTDLDTIEIVADRPTTGTPTLTDLTVTPADTTPVDTTPADTTIPYNPVNTPTPVTPVFPVITPPGTPTTPADGGGTPTTVNPATIAQVNPMRGLNPGWIAPTPFYNTTSPAQSQYFWGSHPFQAGPAFNAQLYNQAPAPETPWGIQNIAQPLTPQEVTRAYQGQPIVRPPLPVATRYEDAVAGPVVPA